jgi:hypothetical protein
MNSSRFWVVGGDFRSLNFDEIVSGTERLLGPFVTRGEAEHAWRDVAERTRSRCTTRFTIVQEGQRAAA